MAGRTPTRKNLFGFGSKPAPVKTRKRTSGLTIGAASSQAREAGYRGRYGFRDWLEAKHLEERGSQVIDRLARAFGEGQERREKDDQLKIDRAEAKREAARQKREKKSESGPSYASAPSEAAIQEGFKRGLTLNEILRGNPGLRKFKVSNPAKFDRCVKAVQKRGGDVNAYAVCTAAGTRRNAVGSRNTAWFAFDSDGVFLGSVEAPNVTIARKRANKKWPRKVHQMQMAPAWWGSKGNPASAAVEVFEEFHGFQPTKVITLTKKVHHHAHLASLGILMYLEVWGIDKVGHTLSGFKKAILASNEDRNQLFIEGGDQTIDISDFGIRQGHELETLGKVLTVAYFTDKKHLGDEGGKAVYVHDFTTTNENGKHVKVPEARLPQLIYDVRNEQLLFSGGSYEILREGINK